MVSTGVRRSGSGSTMSDTTRAGVLFAYSREGSLGKGEEGLGMSSIHMHIHSIVNGQYVCTCRTALP